MHPDQDQTFLPWITPLVWAKEVFLERITDSESLTIALSVRLDGRRQKVSILFSDRLAYRVIKELYRVDLLDELKARAPDLLTAATIQVIDDDWIHQFADANLGPGQRQQTRQYTIRTQTQIIDVLAKREPEVTGPEPLTDSIWSAPDDQDPNTQ